MISVTQFAKNLTDLHAAVKNSEQKSMTLYSYDNHGAKTASITLSLDGNASYPRLERSNNTMRFDRRFLEVFSPMDHAHLSVVKEFIETVRTEHTPDQPIQHYQYTNLNAIGNSGFMFFIAKE